MKLSSFMATMRVLDEKNMKSFPPIVTREKIPEFLPAARIVFVISVYLLASISVFLYFHSTMIWQACQAFSERIPKKK